MKLNRNNKEVLSVSLLCIVWYVVSSSNNVVGKMVLNEFPYPMTITLVQLLSITLYSGPLFNLWKIRRFTDISWKYYVRFMVPMALMKLSVSILSHVSIWKVPVSYAHTVKATMPLFSVVLSRIILGETQTLKIYLSLIPIISGVAIATLTELSFNLTGLLCALAATGQHSLQNIFSKKVLQDTGIHHLRLLHLLGRLAFFMVLPFWLYIDFGSIVNESAMTFSTKPYLAAYLLIDGILNWLQNILAFSIISMVTTLTYAVASATKRIFIIAGSLIVLGNPVTTLNVVGMLLAVMGVLAYNKAKYDNRQQEKYKTVLPYVDAYQKHHKQPLRYDYKHANSQKMSNGSTSHGTLSMSSSLVMTDVIS